MLYWESLKIVQKKCLILVCRQFVVSADCRIKSDGDCRNTDSLIRTIWVGENKWVDLGNGSGLVRITKPRDISFDKINFWSNVLHVSLKISQKLSIFFLHVNFFVLVILMHHFLDFPKCSWRYLYSSYFGMFYFDKAAFRVSPNLIKTKYLI